MLACACHRYYYSEQGTCVACPAGTVCDVDGGSTQKHLILNKGFWRIHSTSTEIYPCPFRDACVGGVNFTASTDYLYNAVGYCKDGYYGPMCGVCANDDKGPNDDYYFSSDTQTCEACFELENPVAIYLNSPTLITSSVVLMTALIMTLKFMFCTDTAALDSKVRR